MSVTRRHGLYGVSIGSTLLGGITRQNLVTGTEVRQESTSGEIYARFQALFGQRIAPGFTTLNLAAALTACGALGGSIADMSGGLSLYAQKHAEGSTRTSGANHRKYNFTMGVLAPQTLAADHRGNASLAYAAVVVYDGVNDPVTITDSFSLPGGLADAERFTLGPVTIGGVSLSHFRSLNVAFGIDVVSEGSDSEIWDTFSSIRGQQTTITFRGIDIEWLKSTNIPLAGKVATHANTTIYLRKRAAGSTFVSDGTAEHIKMTGAGLCYVEQPFDMGQQDPAEVSLVLPLKYDGSNAPLVFDLASAIA